MEIPGELGLPAEMDHVRDLKDITALGVFGTPALLINDDVKAVGHLPSREALKKWLIPPIKKTPECISDNTVAVRLEGSTQKC